MARSSRSSGRPGSPRARLFVALDLPEPERSELAAWRDRAITGRDDLRPVAVEALHMTLAFLGYMPEKEVGRIADAAFGAALRLAAPRLAARGVVAIPPRGRPRLFALDLDDPDEAARSLQAAVSDALEAAGLYTPEKRPFWPHVTLARVKRGARAGPLEADAPPAGELRAADLTLYRSILRPQGALYEPLERFRVGEGIRLRPARGEDADTIGHLTVRAWQAAYRALLPAENLDSMSPAERALTWRGGLEVEGFETWVAERDGLVGYVAFGPARREELSETAEVYALYVDPDVQRRGIGRLLLDRAVERMRRREFRHAVLYVIEGNELGRSFYEGLAWALERGPQPEEVRGLIVPLVRYGLELP